MGIVEAGSNGTVMNRAENFATRWKIRYIAKFSLYSEFSLYRKKFSIIANFRYIAKILFVSKSSALLFCV